MVMLTLALSFLKKYHIREQILKQAHKMEHKNYGENKEKREQKTTNYYVKQSKIKLPNPEYCLTFDYFNKAEDEPTCSQ